MKLFSFLAVTSLVLPLAGCPADPEPVVISASPLACGRQICELDRPVAVGAKLAFQTTPLGIATSARVVETGVATLAPGFLQAEEAYTLTAVAPGRATVEMLDEEGLVVGTQVFDVAAADHLEATITLTTPAGTSQLDRVTAEQPQSVPAAATARIAIDQRRGADALLGWSEYTFEPTLTGAARVVRWDREGNATIELAAGEQAVTFTSTTSSLAARFVLTAR
jgi:hypothetical protein